MKELNSTQVKSMLVAIADAIISSKAYLTQVDSRIGDGDHGIGMEVGMLKAKEVLSALPDVSYINDLFKSAGRAMLMSMGGASGVIFGTMFQGGAGKVPQTHVMDAQVLRGLFRYALDAIKTRGGAQVGDKTMIDALEPAVLAMEACVNDDLRDLLCKAVVAANEGVNNTKNQIAKFGRAKTLGERAIGFQDAGATSVSIIFTAMRDYVSVCALI